jgi:hypothetical protein
MPTFLGAIPGSTQCDIQSHSDVTTPTTTGEPAAALYPLGVHDAQLAGEHVKKRSKGQI